MLSDVLFVCVENYNFVSYFMSETFLHFGGTTQIEDILEQNANVQF
jgi:hypothetical protein